MAGVFLKRVKGDAVHYAARVEPSGDVTRWVEFRADAVPLTEAEVRAVRDRYAGRPLAGTLEFVRLDGSPAKPPPRPPAHVEVDAGGRPLPPPKPAAESKAEGK